MTALGLFDTIAPAPAPDNAPRPCVGCDKPTRLALLVCTQVADHRMPCCLTPKCETVAVEKANERDANR